MEHCTAATTLTQPTTLDGGACEPRVGTIDCGNCSVGGRVTSYSQPGYRSRPLAIARAVNAIAATPAPLGWPWNYVNIATSVYAYVSTGTFVRNHVRWCWCNKFVAILSAMHDSITMSVLVFRQFARVYSSCSVLFTKHASTERGKQVVS